MSMYIFYHPDWQSQDSLPADQAHHALRVLRLSVGHQIGLADGKGHNIEAQITKISGSQVFFAPTKQHFQPPTLAPLALLISPVKHNERLEWLLEKATETGVSHIVLVQTSRTEHSYLKKERLEKIMISALKQSKQPYLPDLQIMNFEAALVFAQKFELRLIAALCLPPAPLINTLYRPNISAAMLIGPEGDFTANEITQAAQSGFETVSLGTARLRTETAGLYTCMVHYFINQSGLSGS